MSEDAKENILNAIGLIFNVYMICIIILFYINLFTVTFLYQFSVFYIILGLWSSGFTLVPQMTAPLQALCSERR